MIGLQRGIALNFEIGLQDRTVELLRNQGFTVPQGTVNKTRAPERTVVLMIEGTGVKPTRH